MTDDTPTDVTNIEISTFKKLEDVPNKPRELDAKLSASLPPFMRNLRAIMGKATNPNPGDVAHTTGRIISVDTPNLFDRGIMAHEMTHVFQGTRQDRTYDNPSPSYDYGDTKGLESALREHKTIRAFSMEQQANMVEDYYRMNMAMLLLAKKQGGHVYADQAKWFERQRSAYEPFMQQLVNMPESGTELSMPLSIPAPSAPSSNITKQLELSPSIAGILPRISVIPRGSSINTRRIRMPEAP